MNLDLVVRSERLPRVGETLTDATFARSPCVIFRPQSVELTDGSRYVVEITGLTDTAGQPATISYMVIFVNAG